MNNEFSKPRMLNSTSTAIAIYGDMVRHHRRKAPDFTCSILKPCPRRRRGTGDSSVALDGKRPRRNMRHRRGRAEEGVRNCIRDTVFEGNDMVNMIRGFE